MNSIYCSNLSIESCRTELSKYYAYVNYYYYFYQQEQQEQQQNAVGASEEEGGNSGQSKKRKRESFETSEIKPRKYITYYVSNLPKGTTQMQIKELFEKTGTVSSVKFSNKAGGGLSSGSGFCYVKMMFEQDDNNQQSEAVISELNGTEIIPGFPIVVQFSAENKQANNPADSQLQADPNQHNTIITISNLNPSTELQKLQDFIKQKLIESDEKNNETYNKIALSPEKPDPNDPFSRSASFTLPSSSSAAILSVLNLSGVEFDGRSLTLKSNNKQLDLINSSTTVRITGFNKSTKIEKFTEIISEIGEIKRIHRNNQGTKIFVDMTSSNDAIKVVRKLNQSRIDDFTITASLTSSELSGSNTNRPKYTSFSNRSFNSRSNSRYDPKPKPKPKMLMTPRSVASRPSKP
ncbi:hypothetical protein AX774_g3682 [Zancudomyces culisetae]|uniref:RRM domain-containing protein n=1 Tax=Zancudomyces culisetae TaxID=1213189 RepID=A0A1R1PPB5_ZANCU|nr:hypothetical protein AX774_g3682 [Zancudomyces culisetae]|eukprot:OMH82826.1 hypothetical protein AX774_g3682 [Zancudomyces culisetae]